MSNDSTIAEALRAARGEVDLITKLKSTSLEARRDRIAEALQNPDWDGAPAELIASYQHHAIARKEGVLMRLPVTEQEDGSITFGKADVFSVPTPVDDIGTEVMETAKRAVDFLLSEDFDSADPMIRGIASALDVKGDLHRRLSMSVQLKSLGRKAWWEESVNEQYAHEIEIPEWVEGSDVTTESVDVLHKILKEGAGHAVPALKALHDAEHKNTGAIEAATDIAEDLKSALSILNDVNRSDLDEMTQVHEEVRQVMPRLLAGINFLTHLTGATSRDSGQE